MQSRAVRWLTLALEDLHDIAADLAEKDLDAAKEVAQCIWNAGQSLAVLSSRGRAGRVAGTRELVLTDFSNFIAYRVVESEVQILRILHAGRRYSQ